MNTKQNSIQKMFRNRKFSLLWAGQGISLLGDQFEMIAVPWLVLKLTNDPLALGSVLALSSIPRALFMLLGGAISDRFSARTIMLISDAVRLVLATALAAAVFAGMVQTWMLYAFALSFGLVSGFFSPAANSMVPHIVDKEDLQAGNALMGGTAQLTVFLGPVLAGGLIALFAAGGSAEASVGLAGIALALALDAFSFLASIVTLLKMGPLSAPQAEAGESVLASIRRGIRYAMHDSALKVLLIVVAAANLFLMGPVLVGIPVLAQLRLEGGAAAYGLIMGAYGGGSLLGILLAGSLPRPGANQMSLLLVGLLASFGAAMIALAFVTTTWLAFTIMLITGIGDGYLGITAMTLLQQRTPGNMLGRVMSLVMFANVGLAPVSQTLAGVLIKLNLEGLFVGAGILLVLLAGWALLSPDARSLGEGMLQAAPVEIK
jgi:MFS family permease